VTMDVAKVATATRVVRFFMAISNSVGEFGQGESCLGGRETESAELSKLDGRLTQI